jgi:hypothetical protein
MGALFGPRQGQPGVSHQTVSRQRGKLFTIEDRADDVGREKRQS